ncbi:MAG TPA: hypothetical protein VFQ59_01995 [Candidatus Paceibacterota bacterium]|nr:hypothetical protein [Candidatus Paceibacterota bacterium]
MPHDPDKLNRIEELKTKLSSKGYEVKAKARNVFSATPQKTVPDSWENDTPSNDFTEKFLMKTSVFKRFFIFSIAFFLLAAGFAAYTFFGKGNTISNENIEISILGNAFTAGGEELPLQIEIINRNTSPLELADLIIEYPRNASFDFTRDTERLRVSLGTVPSGGVRNENVKVVLFGEQGSIKPIRVSLEYRVEGSNAIFVKEKSFEVSISSTPINLFVEGPTALSPNQDITLDIKAILNATRAAQRMLIKVDYPVGFQFASATPAPTIGNNMWSLGDLSPGAERKISISGKMVEVSDGEEKTFRIYSGSESTRDKTEIGTIFNSLGHTVAIQKPFIEASLSINGAYQREYAVDSKTKIHGSIVWSNNLNTSINDVVIKAKISGNAVNRSTIETQGFYNSSEDTITWDKNSISELGQVGPGRTGTVAFTFESIPLTSPGGGMLPEPSARIDVSIAGRQPITDNAEDLKNTESKIIRIISDVNFAAKALYYSGAFTNTGPIPPKAEQKTTYTVVWSVTNTANNISNAQIRSTLPQWVRFVGPISPPAENLNFNPSTKEIIWEIGNMPRGLGVTGAAREVSFQVELLASLSQVGTTPVLVNDMVLTGRDDFAKVDVRVNKGSINTRLQNDPSFPVTGDRVVE